jgi:polysaccharide deacetylase 2 family uncharacterized protein YibQ
MPSLQQPTKWLLPPPDVAAPAVAVVVPPPPPVVADADAETDAAASPPPSPAARPDLRRVVVPRPVVSAALVIPPPAPPPPVAVPLPPGGTPRLAIVVDDVGPAAALAHRAAKLPRPVTLAILPYAEGIPALIAEGRANGHEIFLHLPMEPVGREDPGPNAILTSLGGDEALRRIDWAFARVPGAVGVNNHMGSRATADPESMARVLEAVRRRGLVFLDSRTSPVSVGMSMASRLGVPHLGRDVFLDNSPATSAILARLDEAERLARQRGQAVAIGHPYPTTLAVLARWLPEVERRGIKLVTASALAGGHRCPETAPPDGPIPVSACSGPDCRVPPSPAGC